MWPAHWVKAGDKSGHSTSQDVINRCEARDSELQNMPMESIRKQQNSLNAGNVFSAWESWSTASEVHHAMHTVQQVARWSPQWYLKKKGMLKTRVSALAAPKYMTPGCSCCGDGSLVHMYRDSSIAPNLNQRRRLKTVLDVLQSVRDSGFSISRWLELSKRWKNVITAGPLKI